MNSWLSSNFGDSIVSSDRGTELTPEQEAWSLGVTGPITSSIWNRWETPAARTEVSSAISKPQADQEFSAFIHEGVSVLLGVLSRHYFIATETQRMVLMSQKLESEDYDSDSEDLLTTGRHARRTHYSFVKNVEAYRSYFEQFLCCCFVWGDGSETLQDFPEPVRDVLVSFSIQVRHCTQAAQAGDDDAMDEMCLHIQTLLLGLSNRRAETREGYPNDPMQRCVIGLLLDEKTGFAEHEARANKLANSLKYFIRGVWLIEIVDNEDKVLVARKCLDLNGFSPFAGLHRVQNGLVAFKKVQQERVNFLNDQRMVVDNVELGPNVFQKTIQVCEFQCNKLLERVLLRDFDQSSMEENFPILSKETLSYEHFAELTQSVDDPGAAFGVQKHDTRWGLLLHHFFDSGNGPVRFRIKGEDLRVKNIADAHKYLRDCLKFERLAMAMMHFLTGCSNRATTEFAGMNFRNGGRINIRKKVSSRSSFSVVQDSEGNCEWIHIEGTSAKTSLLKGIPVDKSQLVPRKKIRSLLAYWLVVRPFAIVLAKVLAKTHQVKPLSERYRTVLEVFTSENAETRCFLQGLQSQVTLNIKNALGCAGTEATFQSCRHAGQTIFARWVVPLEHALQSEYAYNSAFGHSALVGLGYGAEIARGNANQFRKSIDLCALRRIWSSFHRLLDRKALTEEQLQHVVEENGLDPEVDPEVDSSDSDSSKSSSSESSSDSDDDGDEGDEGESDSSSNESYASKESDSSSNESHDQGNNEAAEEPEEGDHPKGAVSVLPYSSDTGLEEGQAAQADSDLSGDEFQALEDDVPQEVQAAQADSDSGDEFQALEDDVPQQVQASQAEQGLRKLGFPDGARSEAQGKMLDLVLEGDRSVLAVLGTGGGKSMAWMVPLIQETEGRTILVLPLFALLEDVKRKLNQLQQAIPLWTWVEWRNLSNGNHQVPPRARLIVVSPEDAARNVFLTFLKEQGENIRRVVFDEPSLYVESSFRYDLGALPWQIRACTKAPFILLSATISPASEARVEKQFQSPLTVVRSRTVRSNVSVCVEQYRSSSLAPTASPMLQYHCALLLKNKYGLGNWDSARKERAIVFVLGTDDAARLVKYLGGPRFQVSAVASHSKLERAAQVSAMKAWVDGTSPVMVASSGFLYGIDYPHVRQVVFLGGAYNLTDLVQGLGRAGRDNESSECTVLLVKKGSALTPSELCDQQVVEFLRDATRCRLQALSAHFDSTALKQPLEARCGSCDVCKFRKAERFLPLPSVEYSVELNSTKSLSECHEMAKRELTSKRDLVKRVLGVAASCKKYQICMICLVHKKQRVQHPLKYCPCMFGKCFRCGSKEHFTNVCPNQARFAQTTQSSRVCQACCLPSELFGVQIHGESGFSTTCPYKDLIVPTVLAFEENVPENVHMLARRDTEIGWLPMVVSILADKVGMTTASSTTASSSASG